MKDAGPDRWPTDLFFAEPWEMTLGERAALEGLLVSARPGLAIEVGMAGGGSLARIAQHCDEVHTIDLVAPAGTLPPNVQHHLGDSREVLPTLLAGFADAGRNVDFVLVDGDHSTQVIRTDLLNLLTSAAVNRTLIVLHDTMNEAARAGIESVKPEEFAKVRFVDLDFLTGFMARVEPFEDELWGGFGIVVVDETEDDDEDATVPGAGEYYRAHGALKYDAHVMIDRVARRRRREQMGRAAAALDTLGARLRRAWGRSRGRGSD